MATRGMARVQTALAKRYMTQLCKHFEHRLTVKLEDESGEIKFPAGICTLHVEEDALAMSVTAEDESLLPQLQDVVARHLVRFAFREEIVLEWA